MLHILISRRKAVVLFDETKKPSRPWSSTGQTCRPHLVDWQFPGQLSCIKDGLVHLLLVFLVCVFNARCSRHGGNGVLIALWVMDLRPGPGSCKVFKVSGTFCCVKKPLRLTMGTVSPVKSTHTHIYIYVHVYDYIRISLVYSI